MPDSVEWIDKLREAGLPLDNMDKLLPRGVRMFKHNYQLSVKLMPDGQTLVEYIAPRGTPFPCAFITKDPNDARAMMALYLREQRMI